MSDDRRVVVAGPAAAAAQRAAQANPGTPNGASRSQPFAAEIRSQTVIVNGQERVKLVGCASVTEKRYPMWDMFGEYEEVVDQNAFAGTLSRKPDVAYLVNHRGMTMARTTNDTLILSADAKGLQTEAYVNPKRSDVAARQTELLRDLRKLPEGAQREAVARMTELLGDVTERSSDVPLDAPATDTTVDVQTDVPVEESPTTRTLDEARAAIDGTGRSIDLVRRKFDLLAR